MATIANVAPTTRLRLTARGRRVLASIAALPAVIAIALAVLGLLALVPIGIRYWQGRQGPF